jgi:hypothetical protein
MLRKPGEKIEVSGRRQTWAPTTTNTLFKTQEV